jgi:hypothetical protein
MSPNSQNSSDVPLLGSFASTLTILSLFLYFIGWIYRWSYFSFFEIEVFTLNLPLESFLLVPIQVILGDFRIFFCSILVALVTIILILFTLSLIGLPETSASSSRLQLSIYRLTQNTHIRWLFKPLRFFAQFFPSPLRYEITIVLWILTALFWLGYSQGRADAYRDAVNRTSTRPMITIISPDDKMTLGRNLDDLLTNPTLKKSRIIGDVEQFQQIFGRETNDTNNPENPIIWRLLIENDSWVYLFPAMPNSAKKDERPPVLAINTGDGQVQLMIRSRKTSS